MNNILEKYKEFRKNDKRKIGTLPIDNRLILSKLITDSSADVELKYVWINRAVSQTSINNSTAILGLLDSDADVQKSTRRMTFKLKEIQGYPMPQEINSINELNEFINSNRNSYLVIKQNYPNYGNEEYQLVKKWAEKNNNINIFNANFEEGNTIIGSNEALEKLSARNKEWIDKKVEEYMKYFCNENKILEDKYIKEAIEKMQSLVKRLLIPMELYKGSIEGLRKRVKELLSQNFLPVFKFSDSISGYGVHYPKKLNGEYNYEELDRALCSEEELGKYLLNALNKNGQKVDMNHINNTISKNGIIIQKYINGKDYAIGFFKPLKIYNKDFKLGMIDIDLSDVLTDGTAHFADILHYEEGYLSKILENTVFNGQSELLYFSIEILIYLICVNEELINKPDEFSNINFEDFGIQFMVNDFTGEMGIIEINGRTPSHNFNNFNLLSTFGIDFCNKIPSKQVLCTSTKVLSMNEYSNIIQEQENELVKILFSKSKEKFGDRLQLNSFQIMDNQLAIYFLYFLDEKDIPKEIINNVNLFFRDVFKEVLN